LLFRFLLISWKKLRFIVRVRLISGVFCRGCRTKIFLITSETDQHIEQNISLFFYLKQFFKQKWNIWLIVVHFYVITLRRLSVITVSICFYLLIKSIVVSVEKFVLIFGDRQARNDRLNGRDECCRAIHFSVWNNDWIRILFV
jgi:hypothetical protein